MSDEQPTTSLSDRRPPQKRESFREAGSAYVRDVVPHLRSVTGRPKQVYDAALIGACIVFLAALLAVSRLDAPLQVAVFAFVIAIPLLVMALIVVSFEHTPGMSTRGERSSDAMRVGYSIVAEVGGTIAVVVGVTAVVWHLNGWAVLVGYAALVAGYFVSEAVGMWYVNSAQPATPSNPPTDETPQQ